MDEPTPGHWQRGEIRRVRYGRRGPTRPLPERVSLTGRTHQIGQAPAGFPNPDLTIPRSRPIRPSVAPPNYARRLRAWAVDAQRVLPLI